VHLAENGNRQEVELAGPSYEKDAAAVIDALVGRDYQQIVYASSGVLYGDREYSPRKPSDAIHVVDAYTRVKCRSETAVLDTGRGIVARLSNVYGPGMAIDTVMSTILRQIPGGGAVQVRDGAVVRDFLWVDDAAAALAAAAMARRWGIYNVGAGVGTSIEALAREALGLAGEDDRAVVATASAGRFSSLVLDIFETARDLRWSPAISLREGLARLMTTERRGE
jgi:UDP-glucose 4-epimerase